MKILDKEFLSKYQIVDVGYTEEETPLSLENYNKWIDENKHGPLLYLSDERKEKRQSVKNHWENFQSALVFLFSYEDAKVKLENFYRTNESNGLKIASYTLGFGGIDYHLKIKESLIEIAEVLKSEIDDLEYKLTLDTHPVLERDLAYRSGLGFFGKNSMLINRQEGSFFIIGSILLNQKLNIETKKVETDHCGTCTRCIDACPTKAIDEKTRSISSSDCISTFTIEQFKIDSVPSNKMDLTSGYIFGCDICQDVCPWNNKRLKTKDRNLFFTSEGEVNLQNIFLKKNLGELKKYFEEISNNKFKHEFKNTSFERSGKRGILKNIYFYLKQMNQ